ncbi:MAG: radical SAM protein [Clostridia bacterium]|nr:radical SAM protein [Clostridia bacterium]
MICNLCPRKCGAYRDEYIGEGFCKTGTRPKLARCALHFDEEPCISGTRGSGAVFFSGCQLKCAYCQNYGISHGCFGDSVDASRLRDIFFELIAQGAHNINLVSGTHFVPGILKALKGGLPVPVVWNSSGYESVSTLRALAGAVDVYLPDFKYMDGALAERLSGAADYPEVAVDAIGEMLSQSGKAVFDESGLIRKGTIIRHLVLPNHLDNTKQVLRRIKWDFEDAYLSLMAQYVPMGRAAEISDINRPLTREEYDEALETMYALGLENGYTQELSAATSAYTPEFDLRGVHSAANG